MKKRANTITTKEELMAELIQEFWRSENVRQPEDFTLIELQQDYERTTGTHISRDALTKKLRKTGYKNFRVGRNTYVWRKPSQST